MNRRYCAAEFDRVCLDLASAPLSNAYLSYAALRAPEVWYFLRLLACERCWLVPRADRPDDVVLLPWNLRDELMTQLDYVRGWGGRFVTAVPELRCVP